MMKIGTTIRGYRLQKGLSQGGCREAHRPVALLSVTRRERPHRSLARYSRQKSPRRSTFPLLNSLPKIALDARSTRKKLTDEELRFLTQIRRYSTNLNDSDRKLLLAMVKKFATATAAVR